MGFVTRRWLRVNEFKCVCVCVCVWRETERNRLTIGRMKTNKILQDRRIECDCQTSVSCIHAILAVSSWKFLSFSHSWFCVCVLCCACSFVSFCDCSSSTSSSSLHAPHDTTNRRTNRGLKVYNDNQPWISAFPHNSGFAPNKYTHTNIQIQFNNLQLLMRFTANFHYILI